MTFRPTNRSMTQEIYQKLQNFKQKLDVLNKNPCDISDTHLFVIVTRPHNSDNIMTRFGKCSRTDSVSELIYRSQCVSCVGASVLVYDCQGKYNTRRFWSIFLPVTIHFS